VRNGVESAAPLERSSQALAKHHVSAGNEQVDSYRQLSHLAF
jgi:hypothetical protein